MSACEIIYNVSVICSQLNLSAGRVGLLMIGLSLPYGAASPVFGIISDKYPVSAIYHYFRGADEMYLKTCVILPPVN